MSRKKNREYKDYVEDIYNEIRRTIIFTDGMNLCNFMEDEKTIYAVMKALENMGEASKRIPEMLRKKYPDIPFKQMAGLRDVVTHNYDGISYDMVWEVVSKDLPPLEEKLYDMLAKLEEFPSKK